jgi:Flp pilus assembly pilin Flp
MRLFNRNKIFHSPVVTTRIRSRAAACLENQHGQAIIEFAFLATFLAIILLAMVIIHELGMKNTIAIDLLRQEMRGSMLASAGNPFAKNKVQKDVFVDIPGKMKQVFDAPFFTAHHEIEFYEGSYQGSGDSLYRRKFLYRKIELEN